jgi:hypothetical protein
MDETPEIPPKVVARRQTYLAAHSIVKRPFLLDFAQAELDRPFPELDDPAWLNEKSRLFGADWPDVRRLLNALRQYVISFRDVHKGNISLRP